MIPPKVLQRHCPADPKWLAIMMLERLSQNGIGSATSDPATQRPSDPATQRPSDLATQRPLSHPKVS